MYISVSDVPILQLAFFINGASVYMNKGSVYVNEAFVYMNEAFIYNFCSCDDSFI